MKIIFFANTDWFLYNFCLDFIQYVQNKGIEVVLMSPPGPYTSYFSKQGVRWIPLDMERRSLNPFREMYLLKKLYTVYQQERPNIVHNFTIKSVIYGGLAAQAAQVNKRIHAITGLGYVFINSSFTKNLLRIFVQILLKIALRGEKSRLILLNIDDYNFFKKKQIIHFDKINLIKSSGVNTKSFIPNLKKNKGKFKVLLAARLLWEKGIKEYVEAASLLAHRSHEIEFLLAGAADSGNPSAIPAAQINEWKNSGRLQVLGHVDNIQELLSTVDIMVLPSYREGVPQGLLEAAAAGLPLITTDSPGCREVVEHGVNGFLVPIKDAAALAEKIAYLVDHPELCQRFGQAGREKVLKEFDQQIIFAKTWAVYQSLGL